MNQELEGKTETKSTIENNANVGNPATETQKVESKEDINWRSFREERQREREEKAIAEKRAIEKTAEAEALKKAMEALLIKQPSSSSTGRIDENSLEGNSGSSGEHSESDRIKAEVQRALHDFQKAQEAQRVAKEYAEFPQRLVQNFPDFNEVCTSENLDYLEYHYPEVAAAFKGLPEGYDRWSKIYKAAKRFIPNPSSKKDQSKAEKNMSKPQSMSVSGHTSTGDTAPINLDDARRRANWSRMQRVMKGGK